MSKKCKKKKREKDQRDDVSEDPNPVPGETDQELEKAILNALPAITRLLSQK